MIARISGTLEHVGEVSILVAPNGSGLAYEVWVPSYLLVALAPSEGQEIELTTVQLFEPVGGGAALRPRLIGFTSDSDRRFYEVFTTVKGVGGRRALRAMAIPAARIARAIEEDDAAALRGLPEIGKRLAETVIAELRGKVTEFLVTSGESTIAETKPTGALTDAAGQAIEALVRLGQTRAEAERAVTAAMETVPEASNADVILAAAFAGRP